MSETSAAPWEAAMQSHRQIASRDNNFKSNSGELAVLSCAGFSDVGVAVVRLGEAGVGEAPRHQSAGGGARSRVLLWGFPTRAGGPLGRDARSELRP